LNEGEDLPSWHPLFTGCIDSVENANVSIKSFAINESDVDDIDDLEDYIIEWLN
jgi:uncharacterized cysteine cluster protein YcgN (CxxCxxCC family)